MEEKQGGNPEKPPEASKENKETLDASSIKDNEHLKDRLLTIEEIEVEEVEAEEATPIKEAKIAIRNNKLDNVPIDKINTPGQLAHLAEMIVGGNMCPYKSTSDAVIALMAGKELGLSFSATLQGVYPIEGKPSLGVHLKKGILLNANIIFRRTHDMEEYYEFVDFNPNATYNENSKPSVVGYGYLKDLAKFKSLCKYECRKMHIDTRTEYLFIRYFTTPKGVIKNTCIGMFGINDANQANLLKKDNWKKYTRDMLSSRAFSRGANEIADDLLLGMYSVSELADMNDSVTYYIDEEGREVVVKDEMINKKEE